MDYEKDKLRYCIEYINPRFLLLDNGNLNVRHLRVPDEHWAEMAITIILSFGGKIYALYRGNVKDGKLAEWQTPMIVEPEDWFSEEWKEQLVNNNDKFQVPESSIKDDVSVQSRYAYIPDKFKPIADFIIDYAGWNLHKDEWNHPVAEVPLFRVLDALIVVTRTFLEQVFPELRESKDERIRECICMALTDVDEQRFKDFGTTLKDCLSWLEKQKEQKSLNISAVSEWLRKKVCNYVNSEYNEFHKCVEYNGSIDKERLIKDFEDVMQKEQKPEIYSPLCDTIKDKIREYIVNHFTIDTVVKTDVNSIVKAMEEGVRLGKESQKPAITSKFNVGDKIYYKGNSRNRYVIKEVREDYYINGFGQRMDMSYTDSNFELLEHLDALPLVAPSKSAEWSEEDEKMLQRIIRHTESEYQDWCNDKYGNSEIVSDGKRSCLERLDWLENRLKSLRPQSHWKPSEEQMEAMEFVIKDYREDGCIATANYLQEILEQIKKL